jgi:hypothetical protein
MSLAPKASVPGSSATPGLGRRRQHSSASAFKVAMPTARESPLSASAPSINSAAGRPASVWNPAARAETGQHMSPGMASRGVAQVPATPAVSLTPVKKRPITARSTAISSSSRPRMSVTQAIVSFKMALCTGPPSSWFPSHVPQLM